MHGITSRYEDVSHQLQPNAITIDEIGREMSEIITNMQKKNMFLDFS